MDFRLVRDEYNTDGQRLVKNVFIPELKYPF